jgi:hypothetical protein
VSTHVQNADIVEKHNSGNRFWIDRRTKDATNPGVASSGLADYCRPKIIELIAKNHPAFG